MSRRLVTPATTLPVSVDEVRANSRVTTTAEDVLIETYIRAATAHSENWTGIAIEPSVWEEVLDAFPTAEIMLTLGPVVSITSVKYDDADGIEQTVAVENYEVDTASRDGWVVPVSGYSWPTTMDTINAVRVRYVAGRGISDQTIDIKHAVTLIASHWINQRETAAAADLRSIPFGATSLLDLHRRLFV